MLAVTGAGCALALSEMPFQKTIAGVRVGYVDGAYVINPTFAQRKTSKLDLIIAGSADAIMMVEAGAQEVPEEQMVGALDAGHTAIKQIVATIDDLAKAAGKKKLRRAARESNHDFYREVEEKVLRAALRRDADQGQARELRPRRSGARGTGGVGARSRGRAPSSKPRRSSRA